jgi:hypothetical protein
MTASLRLLGSEQLAEAKHERDERAMHAADHDFSTSRSSLRRSSFAKGRQNLESGCQPVRHRQQPSNSFLPRPEFADGRAMSSQNSSKFIPPL